RLTLPEMLKERGYSTACIGKWHLGFDWEAIRKTDAKQVQQGNRKVWPPDSFDWSKPIPDGPLEHGFDYYFGDDVPNFPPYCWIENDRIVKAPTLALKATPKTAEGSWEARPGPMVEGWKLDAVMPRLTEKAIEWISAQSGSDRPFFLYFPWTSPHAPIVPTADWKGKSSAGGYGDFMAQSDHHAGQIIDALEKHGFTKNTLVIFTSDNGPERYAYNRIRNFDHHSSGPLRGLKRDVWEGGHRIPMLVRWPGVIEPGSVTDGLMSQIDIMATLAAVVEYELPADAADDGHNQLQLWKGGPSARKSHVHNTGPKQFAIRKDNWLLINAKSGMVSKVPKWFDERYGYQENQHPAALYDLSQDVSQHENLYAEQPERVESLRALLKQTRAAGETSRGF
ncbi:MAG: sulfatase family protein, partial [Aeoliella sp.]